MKFLIQNSPNACRPLLLPDGAIEDGDDGIFYEAEFTSLLEFMAWAAAVSSAGRNVRIQGLDGNKVCLYVEAENGDLGTTDKGLDLHDFRAPKDNAAFAAFQAEQRAEAEEERKLILQIYRQRLKQQ